MSDCIAIPETFSFLEQVPLDPRMANTPLWRDAPLAPARLGWGPQGRRIARLWAVDVCPYCGDHHAHSAETEDPGGDPRTMLGGRLAHCTREPWASVSCEYRLIGIKPIGSSPSKKELKAFFPRAVSSYDHAMGTWHHFPGSPEFKPKKVLVGGYIIRPSKPLPSDPTGRQPIPRELRAATWNKSQGRCYFCGCQTNPFENFAVDHLVPVADGGTNDPQNLVPSCAACNGAKGAMSLTAFRAKRGGGLFWFEIAFTGGTVLLP